MSPTYRPSPSGKKNRAFHRRPRVSINGENLGLERRRGEKTSPEPAITETAMRSGLKAHGAAAEGEEPGRHMGIGRTAFKRHRKTTTEEIRNSGLTIFLRKKCEWVEWNFWGECCTKLAKKLQSSAKAHNSTQKKCVRSENDGDFFSPSRFFSPFILDWLGRKTTPRVRAQTRGGREIALTRRPQRNKKHRKREVRRYST